MHPAAVDIDTLLVNCEVRHVKRGGPGGQHRNKTQSGVVIQHMPTGIIAEANERRDQSQNFAVAIQRLRVELALAVRDAGEKPSERWRRRCTSGRISVAADHTDFPALLAEALDVVVAQEFDVPRAAAQLQCSASQLLKLLALEYRALQWLNRQRQARALPALRPGR